MWDKCLGCGEILYKGQLEESLYVCPNCEYHFRIPAQSYEEILLEFSTLTYFGGKIEYLIQKWEEIEEKEAEN